MREFFDDIPLNNEEEISEERLDNIKTSVLSRVKEEKAMSKRTTIKTFTIAVAAATTAALSAMIASAEQAAWTPATDVDYTIYDAAETDAGEVPAVNNIDEAQNDEKVLDKPLSEGFTVNPEGDYITIAELARDSEAGYIYYYKMSDEEVEEFLNSGWTLIKTSTDE